jgi:hypothetical protein
VSEIFLPLTASQMLARIEQLEQNQIAVVSVVAPALTGPLGVRIMSATNPGQILSALPDTPRRQSNPFTY